MYSSAQCLPLFQVSRHGSAGCRSGPLGGCSISPCNDRVWFVVDWPCRTPAGCKQRHGRPREVAMGPDRGAVGSCSGISPTTEARYISRACAPTAGLLNRGTKSSLGWEGGDTVHLGPCQAHRGEATASRGFCSRARGGVFAEVELTPALDDDHSSMLRGTRCSLSPAKQPSELGRSPLSSIVLCARLLGCRSDAR